MLELIVLGAFSAALLLCAALGISVLYALIFGYILFAGYAFKKHYTAAEIAQMSLQGINTVKNILIVFMLIGMLTAVWRAAGTIPLLVTFSAGLIVPSAFFLVVFLLNCLVSVLTGTAFGTAATSGVICMAMAAGAGENPVYTGGAILSGIFFGDRCSPMSTSALLVSELTETDIFDNIKNMVKTSVVPFAAVCVLYLLMGLNSAGSLFDSVQLSLLRGSFKLHWVTALPAALVIILSLCRINVKRTMMASILAASFICLSVQGNTPEELLRFLIFGYRVPEPELAVMMNGGGILSMVKVSLIVCISSSFSCILEKTGILFGIKKKIGRLGERVTPYGGALLTSLPASMAACNQTLGIILTYQLCKDITDDKKELAIYLENSAVIVAPLVPWSIACAVPLAAISAPETAGCILTAFYLYLLPAWNMICSRRRMNRIKPDGLVN